jgi:hypothetical protein
MTDILDIAHLAFLESIRESIVGTGPAAAKGHLMRRAVYISQQIPETEYESLDEWESAVKTLTHPITRIEGPSIRDGNIFVLPVCPFSPSIKTYKELFQKLPGEYARLVEEYNRPGRTAADLYVGYGSGVSPFCAIHQPLRAAIGKRIKVGGKTVQIVQLGCKGGDGKKAIAGELCDAAGVNRETVEKYLEKGACVYAVKVLEV